MMVDNNLTRIPNAVIWTDSDTGAVNDMTALPDSTSVGGSADKAADPNGIAYTAVDDPGYVLYGHDRTGGGVSGPPVNYFAKPETKYYYTCETDGNVRQWASADCSTATGVEYTY